MSWFDTSSITSLAKSALKEAQKTIDKALDIQQDESDLQTGIVKAAENPPSSSAHTSQKESSDFFSSWGLTTSDSLSLVPPKEQSVITQSPSKAMSQSLWGSFTGSFFENANANRGIDVDKKFKSESFDYSEISVKEETFDQFVNDSLKDKRGSSLSQLNSEDAEGKNIIAFHQVGIHHSNLDNDGLMKNFDSDNGSKGTVSSENHVVLRRSSERQYNPCLNRLSIISSDSGKNSSESIEVLGSQSLKTTPDSEAASLNQSVSASSSMGLKLPSSSVEVLPDSLVSPSSIELLGFTQSAEVSHASDDEFGSPLSSPMDREKTIDSKISLVKSNESSIRNTDDDIKVVSDVNAVNNDDEDASAADDTISYNSISEFTAPTILDISPYNKPSELMMSRKSGSQFCSEMIDSFGSDSSNTTRSIENIPITRAPGRNMSQFSSVIPGSAQHLISKDLLEKQHFQPITSQNSISCDNIIQPFNESLHHGISDSCTSSNEGSWSDRTLNAENEVITMDSSSEDVIAKKTVIHEKGSGSFSVKGMLEEAIIDKLSDKISETSSYCKVNEETGTIHSSWKEGALSSSSQSYEEVDKSSSIDHLENVQSHAFLSREPTSPVSSEGRSVDMVKVGSEQTSGHTSGDDLETTTSSDIEIIPSPNGEYGGTYSVSRQSPAKLPGKFYKHSTGSVVDLVLGKALATKIRGHTRELSEVSNQSNASDESHCSENDRLLKRLAEMAEILESREAKLIEISRKNVELVESNTELKVQVENLSKQDVADVSLITEEYTQRLSALEKKFQQAIREKDVLRKQMETYKQEAAIRMTTSDLEIALGERDETIKELREEGEKLSKQQLHHSTIIKRLRAKEKDNEQVIKTLRDKVADQAQELDRLKRSVTAKEALECSQIETVYKLTTANKKLESELAETKGQLDDTNQKLESLKKSFDVARKEVVELQKNRGEHVKKEEALALMEKEKNAIDSENEQLLHQLEELRNKMRQDEQRWMTRESGLRSEVSRQMARAEEAESALQLSKVEINNGALGGTTAEVGALLAQLATLQENSLEKDRRFQAKEKALQQTAAETQLKLTMAVESHQQIKDECQSLRTKLASVENNLANVTQKLENCSTACEEHMSQLNITLSSSQRLKHDYDKYKEEVELTIGNLNEKLKKVEETLSSEKTALEAEKRRNGILQEQLRDAALGVDQAPGSSLLLARLVGTGGMAGMSGATVPINIDQIENPSPPGSTGRDSIASESLGSGAWPVDDGDSYTMSSIGMGAELNNANASGGLCTLERLQAALQRREGELRAARRAGRRSHAQRTALAKELALHAAELDNMQSLQHQYDALLQMYGEKEEQLQELRLDLQDVKDMYKMQLDEILMLKRQASEQNK